MESKLADLLLDPHAAPAKVQAHVAECERCQGELEELKATMAAAGCLGGSGAEPVLSHPAGRADAGRARGRAGRLAGRDCRLRASIAYGPGLHVRPLAAMALTVMLLLGGGTYLGVTDWMQPAQPSQQAAVVHDLQTLDNNAQVLDQMEALSSNA